MRKPLALGVLIVLMCGPGCIQEFTDTGDTYEIDTSSEPIQEPYSGEVITLEADGHEYTLVRVAQYTASVLVVGVKHYRDEDRELVPVDLCVVWGLLAEPEYLYYVSFIQEDRGCECIYEEGSPVDTPEVLNQFVNMHLIPASETILQAIKTIEEGQRVVLEGFLVDVYYEGSIYIETSTTRADIGEGSCEVLYVTRVRIGNTTYE